MEARKLAFIPRKQLVIGCGAYFWPGDFFLPVARPTERLSCEPSATNSPGPGGTFAPFLEGNLDGADVKRAPRPLSAIKL